jgi:hypothetical protein
MGRKWLLKRPLTIEEILAWATAHREATGKWPTKDSGRIAAAKFETWIAVDHALRVGLRDLPGASSLAQLLAEKYGVRNTRDLPPLTTAQILQWADAHHERTGSWPSADSGTIPDSGGEKWHCINAALREGGRRMSGGSSLTKLLAEKRGARNRRRPPPLTEGVILKWADAFHERTGSWPTAKSGPIPDAPGETWTAVQMALRFGRRSLPGGSSLALLLAEKRGVRNRLSLPNLSIAQILCWADAFHERTGNWPGMESGPIPEAPGETWTAVNHALRRGSRGLRGSCSLAELLAIERDVRNQSSVPSLNRKQILAWADAHHRRTGSWPMQQSGAIFESPGDTWWAIDAALRDGNRGLRPGSSLPQLLARFRGRRNPSELPPLTKKKILAWADAHHERTGKWPNVNSGAVMDAPAEKWDLIDNALRQGHRGQPGGSSLLLLLVKKRGVRNPLNLPPLTEEQILRWADLHFHRFGTWPKYNSGPIIDAAPETWAGVDSALNKGKRELTGGSSLAKFLHKTGRGPTKSGVIKGR